MGSGPFFQILGKMHFDIMHEQYKKDNELQVVGQKSQRRTDNVQGNSTDDQTSIVTEICERVTQRYRKTPASVLTNVSKQTYGMAALKCIALFL